MFQRVPEGFSRLARQGTARGIGDGAGYHDRQFFTALLEHFLHGKDSRFGVQGIEHGFDQDDVSTAVHQAFGGFDVLFDQLVKGDGAETRVIDVWRDRQRLTGRAKHTGHITWDAGFGFHFVRNFAGEGGGGAVQFRHQVLKLVIGLRHACGVEAVGLNDVSTGHKVLTVNTGNDVWLSDDQQIVVAFDLLRDVGEALTTVVFFFQLVALNQSAHAAVEHMNALHQILSEAGDTLLAFGGQWGIG